MRAGIGAASRTTLGFGCMFADFDLDGALDLVVANGHIDETVRRFAATSAPRRRRICFSIKATASFATWRRRSAPTSRSRKSGAGSPSATSTAMATSICSSRRTTDRRICFATTRSSGNRSLRFRLAGTKSNRDAIGATVRIFHGGSSQSRLVKSGSSYLSQSELPVTFGVGRRDRVDRVVIKWPSGATQEFTNVATGRAYDCVEGKGLT